MTAEPTPKKTAAFDFERLLKDLTDKRKDLGLSASQMAQQIGIDAAKISRLKSGGGLSVDSLIKVCYWLNRPVEMYRRPQLPGWLKDYITEVAAEHPEAAASVQSARQSVVEHGTALMAALDAYEVALDQQRNPPAAEPETASNPVESKQAPSSLNLSQYLADDAPSWVRSAVGQLDKIEPDKLRSQVETGARGVMDRLTSRKP